MQQLAHTPDFLLLAPAKHQRCSSIVFWHRAGCDMTPAVGPPLTTLKAPETAVSCCELPTLVRCSLAHLAGMTLCKALMMRAWPTRACWISSDRMKGSPSKPNALVPATVLACCGRGGGAAG
eukprot:1159547-Pelagomonas_calceolata.AAC.12